MAFNHRKFIPTILEDCDYFCDSTRRNTEGYCPKTCISRCNTICYRPFPPIPPRYPPSTPDSDNHSHNKPNNSLHLFLIFSLSIFATTCFIFCIYTLYKLYKNCYNSRRTRRRPSQPQQQEQVTHDQFLDEDQGPMLDHPIWYIRTIGLQPSIINSITICKYKRGEGLVEGTECSVCLSEFQEDETLRLLPKCNHAFHIPCIDTWLRSHTNCPMCRAGIVSNMGNFPVPPAEQRADINPVVREEAQVAVSESSGELREDGDCELGMGAEEGVESSKEEVVESDHLGVDEIQPMRRSVSMDCVSATMISVAIANAFPGEYAENSSTQLVKVNKSNMGIVSKKVEVNQGLLRLVGSSSIGRSLQRGPLSLKRSLSCSGKVFLSRYARSRNSNLPS